MGNRKSAPEAIRIPAQELESLVISRLKDWLNNESTLLKILNPKTNQIQVLSISIKQHQELLQQNTKERYEFIHRLIKQVSVLADCVEMKIDPQALFEDAPHPTRFRDSFARDGDKSTTAIK